MATHHKIFEQFRCWNGEVEAGFSANFLGVLTRDAFFNMMVKNAEKRLVRTELPAFDEEYFEWIDLLEAVTAARRTFTMIELGAGYGRWMANAVAALQATTKIPYKLIGVESEPTHFKWIKQHFKDNQFSAWRCKFVKACAAGKNGWVWFYVGRPDEWYGQAIAPAPPEVELAKVKVKLKAFLGMTIPLGDYIVKRVKAISLNKLLQHLEKVDLIDLDVQGAESEVLQAARKQLGDKVMRVHIGTHGPTIEEELRELFRGLGWENLNDYSCGSESETPYGRIQFGDGVQSWRNPRNFAAEK
jgi:FkbM family methyltransferase